MTDAIREIDLETFEALAREAGLDLDGEELVRMREGWLGLQGLFARFPAAPDLADEPAFAFVGPETRVSR
jgi:hypothetical protein